MSIVIDIFLTVVGLFFTIAVATRHTTYDTNNNTLDRFTMSILWLYFCSDNLPNVISYFKI